jgi:6-phosphogluconolactonase
MNEEKQMLSTIFEGAVLTSEQASRRKILRNALLLTGTTLTSTFSRVAVSSQMETKSIVQPTVIFAYVGSRTTKERNARGDGINVYQMDPATGNWKHIQLVDNLVNPSFLTFDRNQRFLYSVHGDQGEVSAFAVDKATGILTFLNRQSTGGRNPVHLTVDPRNRFLIVANYASGNLSSLSINADGSLEPISHLLNLPGEPGPHKVQQKSSHPHHVPFDLAGKFIVVPDKGLDKVFSIRLDQHSGRLTLDDRSPVSAREGAGTRHIAFHPSQQYTYVTNELDSTITTYRYDADSGNLQPLQIVPTLPTTYTGNNTAAGIAVSLSGNFVYSSNRGHDSIVVYAVDKATHTLSPINWNSSLGIGPRFFALSPHDDFLYAANENSDTITSFAIDKDTGKMQHTGQVIRAGSPVCIVFSTGQKSLI